MNHTSLKLRITGQHLFLLTSLLIPSTMFGMLSRLTQRAGQRYMQRALSRRLMQRTSTRHASTNVEQIEHKVRQLFEPFRVFKTDYDKGVPLYGLGLGLSAFGYCCPSYSPAKNYLLFQE